MSKTMPPEENDAGLGPISDMNWGEEADAGGRFQIQLGEGEPVNKYYYRDDDGKLQLRQAWKDQVARSQIDWRGVGFDLAIILFGAIGGAGGALSAISVTGGSGAVQLKELHDYKKKTG